MTTGLWPPRVGDLVTVYGQTNVSLVRVTKVTAQHGGTIYTGDERRWRMDGRLRGGTGYHSATLGPITPEVRVRLRFQASRARMNHMLPNRADIDWETYDADAVDEAINTIMRQWALDPGGAR